jgi:hypothetical protein
MIEAFIVRFLANVSREVLLDIVRALMKEFILKQDKDELNAVVKDLKAVIDETAESELSDDEKNKRLADAGRGVAQRMRERK